MSIVAGDIVIYGSANIAESDGSTHGGVIDTAVRYVFDDSALANTLNDTLDIISSAAGDTSQTVTITGRNTSGGIVTDAISLNGTNLVNGTTTFERILKIVISASHTGTVTVTKNTGGTTVAAIESAVLTVRRPFYDVAADVSGGSSRDFYEKLFIKNNNGTNAYLNAKIIELTDAEDQITFALANSQTDSISVTTRINVVPASVTAFNSSDKNVPDTNLHSGSGIGVWLKLTLPAGDAATKAIYTIQASGTTT